MQKAFLLLKSQAFASLIHTVCQSFNLVFTPTQFRMLSCLQLGYSSILFLLQFYSYPFTLYGSNWQMQPRHTVLVPAITLTAFLQVYKNLKLFIVKHPCLHRQTKCAIKLTLFSSFSYKTTRHAFYNMNSEPPQCSIMRVHVSG